MGFPRLPPAVSFFASLLLRFHEAPVAGDLWSGAGTKFFMPGSCPQIPSPPTAGFPLRSPGQVPAPSGLVLPTEALAWLSHPSALGSSPSGCLASGLCSLRGRHVEWKPARDQQRQQEDLEADFVAGPSPRVVGPLRSARHRGQPQAYPRRPAASWAGRSRRCPESKPPMRGQVSR